MSATRPDAGTAVAGLFANTSATGGLAGASRQHAGDNLAEQTPPNGGEARGRRGWSRVEPVARVRLGVELTEEQIGFLRALSRPARTGQPRTLGSKFVGTGVLIAAIELLAQTGIDMDGVTAGDLDDMVARVRRTLQNAAD